MKLNDYLSCLAKKPQIITLSYENSLELCEDISKKQISDIPKEYHRDIESLLVERLNSKAVESHLEDPLERLLVGLQETQSIK